MSSRSTKGSGSSSAESVDGSLGVLSKGDPVWLVRLPGGSGGSPKIPKGPIIAPATAPATASKAAHVCTCEPHEWDNCKCLDRLLARYLSPQNSPPSIRLEGKPLLTSGTVTDAGKATLETTC
ncbi:Phosphoenolpyruvate guanylyltransferase [Frankliniella fusca]|uniref:Phosphoenolpyruvate guanylyltransferase n=1 Tax=Frankliniella fusca TaxID=407009 RepID=A0AAE1LW31_9NEOP|nr:Phosphoenolpyruvate guanylyltransferase [Frankliniella fusca]